MAGNVDEIRSKEYKVEGLEKLYNMAAALGITKKKDEGFFAITEFLAKEDNRKNNQNDIVKLCFDYILENKKAFADPKRRAKMDVAMAILTCADSKLAQGLEDAFNADPTVGGAIDDYNNYMARKGKPNRLEKLDVITSCAQLTKTIVTLSNKTLIETDSEESTKLKNLKALYDKLTSKENERRFFSNSDYYNNMIKSVKQVLDYAKFSRGKGASLDVMLKMYDKVKESAEKYIDNRPLNPETPAGQARQKLALALLFAVDKEDGKKKIDEIATKRKAESDAFAERVELLMGTKATKFDKSHFANLKEIIDWAEIDPRVTHEEELESIGKFMADCKKNAYKETNQLRQEAIAQYIIAKTEYAKKAALHGVVYGRKFNLVDIINNADRVEKSREFKLAYNDVAFGGDEDKYGQEFDGPVDVDKVYAKFQERLLAKEKADAEAEAARKLEEERILAEAKQNDIEDEYFDEYDNVDDPDNELNFTVVEDRFPEITDQKEDLNNSIHSIHI